MSHQIELALGLFAVVIALGVLSRWLRVPYPILLVLGGLVLGLVDGTPRVHLAPDLVFLAFLPPLLYAAAFNTEWDAFRREMRSITLLAVGLVLFTTVLVAAVAHHAIGLPWAAGFVLGAIVSPPDAVAATAITRRLQVPKIVSTILEGESLVNDASALVAYRVAVAAVLGVSFDLSEIPVRFAAATFGGVAVGLAGGWAVFRLHRWLTETRLGDAKLQIAITLLTPYAVYLPAEHLDVSGVLAVVACGLWIGARWEPLFNPELYIEGRAVWEMVEFLLNGMVFILIGLQLPDVLDTLRDGHTYEELVGGAVAVSATVIVARIVWMYPGAYVPRWADRQLFRCQKPYPNWRLVTVVAWTGMRGVVSLAAALAVPRTLRDGTEFPGRDMILFLTFWVIFATLVLQGLTLPLLIRALGVSRLPDDEHGEEHSRC